MYLVGDLFAGVGGVALGFEQARFHVKWANEIDKHACITYRNNFKHRMIEGDIHDFNRDINTLNLEKIDILCGGFPCQAFSVAGYRKGFNDDRGNLFFEIMKLADKLNPRVLFLENVKNLQGHDKGNTYKVIEKTLKNRGYYVHSKVLNTCEYSNIPQNRERFYIIAFKELPAYEAFEFPNKVKNTLSTKSLIDNIAEDKYYYKHTKYYDLLKNEMISFC